ncbi:MAG: helix-turn-helix domain-containing protein [Spirochaetales bacterium]|nr:helix-turn-helix domain-containing protein [Spirochaetales bacterium]
MDISQNGGILKDFELSTLGISPGSFIRKKRIQRAQLLLWNTSLPVKAVSLKVGFDDICYFYRVFKKLPA